MVNKTELENSLTELKNDLAKMIEKSIQDLREHIIDNLVKPNKELQSKVNRGLTE